MDLRTVPLVITLFGYRRDVDGELSICEDEAIVVRKIFSMDVFPVNWDSAPEVMNKEQFFRICHISKSTALHLLKSLTFRSITRKSLWHIQTLNEFSRKMRRKK